MFASIYLNVTLVMFQVLSGEGVARNLAEASRKAEQQRGGGGGEGRVQRGLFGVKAISAYLSAQVHASVGHSLNWMLKIDAFYVNDASVELIQEHSPAPAGRARPGGRRVTQSRSCST